MESKLREIAKLVCRGEVSKEHEAFILTSYAKVFKRPFSKCKCQLCDAIFLIIKNIDKMECKFKLKKGIVLTQFGNPKRITQENLTNENAIEHLTARPQDAKFFNYIPAEILAKIKKPEPKDVQEVQNILETLKPEIVSVKPTIVEPKKVEMIAEEKVINKRVRRTRKK